MTKLSVIIPTYRFGGFDVLFGSLKAQTMRDFEVVIVDDLYDQRKYGLKKYAEAMDISLVHIPPKPSSMPFACCNAINTGFIVADGDYHLPSQDFMWFAPDCFERHMRLQKAGRVTVGLMHHYTSYPLGDLNGELTVFDRLHEEKPPDERLELADQRFLANTVPLEGDESLKRFAWYLYTSYRSVLPNAVFPYHFAMELNGFDERLDIGHGYQDDNYIFRGELAGHYEFVLDPGNVSIHLTHPWSRKKPAPNQTSLHYQIMNSVLSGYAGLKAPNSYDLLQSRMAWRHQHWVETQGGLEKPVHAETYEKDYEKHRLDWLKAECQDAESILEIGCGDGYVLRYIIGESKRIGYGLDVNQETIKSNSLAYPDLSWIAWDACNTPLPFTNNSYDFVLLPAILEHLPWDSVASLLLDTIRIAKRKVLVTIPNATYPTFNRPTVESVGKHQWACTKDRLYTLSLAFVGSPQPISVEFAYDEISIYFVVTKV